MAKNFPGKMITAGSHGLYIYIYMAKSVPGKMIMVGSHGLYVYDKELP